MTCTSNPVFNSAGVDTAVGGSATLQSLVEHCNDRSQADCCGAHALVTRASHLRTPRGRQPTGSQPPLAY